MVAAKHYHSYTKQVRYLIADMHPSHIVNALAVINEGRHAKYFVGDAVYVALVTQLLVAVKASSRKRGLAKRPAKKQYATGYPTLINLRRTAMAIIRNHGSVAADSLRHVMDKAGYTGLPGLMFCPVFRGKGLFQPIGRKPSNYPSARGREIRVYVLA